MKGAEDTVSEGPTGEPSVLLVGAPEGSVAEPVPRGGVTPVPEGGYGVQPVGYGNGAVPIAEDVEFEPLPGEPSVLLVPLTPVLRGGGSTPVLIGGTGP